jgi:hypothetical protein
MLFFWFLGFLHGLRGEFTEDVSETVVGPILTAFLLMTSEDGTHSGFRNVGLIQLAHHAETPKSKNNNKDLHSLYILRNIIK